MLRIKSVCVFVAILCFLPRQSLVTGRFPFSSNFLKCSTYDNTVYITDNTNCFVFRNECEMRKNFLIPLRNHKLKFFQTSKAVCQTQCSRNCGSQLNPVCGSRSGISNFTIFPNYCELMKTGCLKGQAIFEVPNTKCFDKDKYIFKYKVLY